jgi:hypothetical protein
MKAILHAGDQVYVAVHTNPADSSAGQLWLFSATDGVAQGTIPLGAAPKFDGMAAAGSRLYVATQDGRILCLAQGPVSVADGGAGAMAQLTQRSPRPPVNPVVAVSVSGDAAERHVADASGQLSVSARVPSAPSASTVLEDRQAALGEEGSRYPTIGAYGPRNMHWRCERACLQVVRVTASSHERTNVAANVADRDLRTRWSPHRDGGETEGWLTCDLGRVRRVSGVTLVCYAFTSGNADVSIELSLDGREFTTVDAGTLSGRGTHTTLRTFLPSDARYVRIRLDEQSGAEGLSVYEVGVHGAPGVVDG